MPPPPTSYLVNWVANTKPHSYKPSVHSCTHSSCRAICRFCHKSSVGFRGFGALGKWGNFCASQHKFTYKAMFCQQNIAALPGCLSYTHQLLFFSTSEGIPKIPSNLGICIFSLLLFHLSLKCFPNTANILENTGCQR